MNKNLRLSILIVEDEKSFATVIAYNLQKEGYNVNIINDGEEALQWVYSSKPDLILLDWVLPSKHGIEVCRALRANPDTANIPIIMISARDQDLDKVAGLDRGADDYLTKPFSPIELIARIKAVLRRIRPAIAEKTLQFNDIVIDLNTYSVTCNSIEVKLAPIEFQILQILMENPGNVFSRNELIEKIWGIEVVVDPRTVDVHMTRLRKALFKACGKECIKTVRLVGYKLQPPDKK